MALVWQNMFIPFSEGIDESVHPKLPRINVPLQLENVYFNQDFALAKRNGFSKIDSTFWLTASGAFEEISDDGAIRDLFSTGDELCAVGARRLFALNEEQGKFYDRGPVSPFTGDQDEVFLGDRSYLATDSYTEGNYVLHAARWFRATSDANWHGIQLKAAALTGDSKTFDPVDVLRTTVVTVDRPHAPKCAACGVTVGVDRQLLCMVGFDGDYTPTQDAEFNIYSYDLATPHLAPTVVVNTGSLWFDNYTATGASAGLNDSDYQTRTYDIIEGLSGNYIYAYVDTNQDIVLVRRNASHVSQATTTITGTFTRVALYQDGSLLYVLAVADASGGTREVQAFTRNITSLVAVAGPANLHTLTGASSTTAGAQNADHLGVVSNGALILWTFSIFFTVPASVAFRQEQRQAFRTTTTGLGSMSAEVAVYNALALAKPFSKLGRFYLPCSIGASHVSPGNPTAVTYRYPAPGWNAAVVLDLDKDLPVENVNPEDPQTGGAYIVGIYHVGVAPNLANHDASVGIITNRNNFRRGSLNAVSTVGDKLYYLSDRYTYFRQGGIEGNPTPLKPEEAGTANDAPPRTGADLVSLDFLGRITSTRLEKGAACIGGGAVFFYSGKECFELGFPVAPFIYEREESAPGAGYPNGTIVAGWQACWWCYDNAGFVHRGFPTPIMSARTMPGAGGPFTEQLRVNSYPGTSKPIPYARLYVYDDSNNGVDIMSPTFVVPNRMQDNETGFFQDADFFKGDFIYTLGGTLENVSPEGSAIVSVALNRLMVTGMYSRGRVHYSQKFTPGTAFEDAIAPEMNEGLGKLFPDGERGTGIAEMDGQAILFTAKSIYGMAGTGPNPTGQIGDFELQLITGDGGCVNPRSVVRFPGGVMFEGTNGIYALLRNHDVVPIGDPVQERLAAFPLIQKAVLWEQMQLVVFACTTTSGTTGVLLCYDYLRQRWYVWKTSTTTAFTSLAVHNDVLYAVVPGTPNLVLKYDTASFKDNLGAGGVWVKQYVLSSHVQLQPDSWLRCRELVAMMEAKSNLDLHVELFKDFSPVAFHQETITNAELATFEDANLRLQPKVKPKKQKCQAFQFALWDSDPGSGTGQGAVMTGVVLQVAPKSGTSKVKKEQRR